GVTLPVGLFQLSLNQLDPSQPTLVTFDLPAGVTANTYYKYGPTADNPQDHWYSFLFNGTTGAEINGSRITLHYLDGQRGDDDLLANGTIQDPGGPALDLGTTTSIVASAASSVYGQAVTFTAVVSANVPALTPPT